MDQKYSSDSRLVSPPVFSAFSSSSDGLGGEVPSSLFPSLESMSALEEMPAEIDTEQRSGLN